MSHRTITIHLTHNSEGDQKHASQMAAKFVDDLKAAGHHIKHASISSLEHEDLHEHKPRVMDDDGPVVF
jgi:hypothetical protein